MQEAINIPHFWAWLVGAFFTGATALATVYKLYQDRKKPKADEAGINLSHAQAEKTLAEAHKIVLDDTIRAHDEAKAKIKELEAKLQEMPRLEESNKLLEKQNERMGYLLKLHRIKYDGSEGDFGNGKGH